MAKTFTPTLTKRQALPRALHLAKNRGLMLSNKFTLPNNMNLTSRPRANAKQLALDALVGGMDVHHGVNIASVGYSEPYANFKTHAEFDSYLVNKGIIAPTGWTSMTLKDKKKWLDDYYKAGRN